MFIIFNLYRLPNCTHFFLFFIFYTCEIIYTLSFYLLCVSLNWYKCCLFKFVFDFYHFNFFSSFFNMVSLFKQFPTSRDHFDPVNLHSTFSCAKLLLLGKLLCYEQAYGCWGSEHICLRKMNNASVLFKPLYCNFQFT